MYFQRTEGCWRIVDGPPADPNVRKLFEAWEGKALRDYFMGG